MCPMQFAATYAPLLFLVVQTVTQVLASVRSMEESLQRLKKKRSRQKAGMSDDDKIRTQLLLDTQAFAKKVQWRVGYIVRLTHFPAGPHAGGRRQSTRRGIGPPGAACAGFAD